MGRQVEAAAAALENLQTDDADSECPPVDGFFPWLPSAPPDLWTRRIRPVESDSTIQRHWCSQTSSALQDSSDRGSVCSTACAASARRATARETDTVSRPGEPSLAARPHRPTCRLRPIERAL